MAQRRKRATTNPPGAVGSPADAPSPAEEAAAPRGRGRGGGRARRVEMLRPIGAVSVIVGGVPMVLSTGELYRADHPAVVKHPELFRPADRARPDVESASAAPGERRGEE